MFTQLVRIVALLVLILGASRIAIEIAIANGSFGPMQEAAARERVVKRRRRQWVIAQDD